jgi:hypothetical protein
MISRGRKAVYLTRVETLASMVIAYTFDKGIRQQAEGQSPYLTKFVRPFRQKQARNPAGSRQGSQFSLSMRLTRSASSSWLPIRPDN